MSPSVLRDDDHTPAMVRTLPLAYDPAHSEHTARQLVYALHPEWEHQEGPLEFVRFKDGITNTLFKAIKRRPGYSDRQIDQEAVLLRAYGNGTDVLIDRDREATSHLLLAKQQLAPELLARFDNGLLYRYIEGTPCTPEDLRRPEVYIATARRLGEWHGVLSVSEVIAHADPEERRFDNINKLLPGKPVPNIWTTLQKWILALPNNTEGVKTRNAWLTQELEYMTKLFGHTQGLDRSNYVVSHCDLLSGNVIIHPQDTGVKNEVSFIDYEYATPGPAAFDLANHFAEWAGFDCDFNFVPTRSQRREFLHEYVRSFRLHVPRPHQSNGHTNGNREAHDDEAEQADLQQLMDEVDAFRGMPGLFWGVWGLIQAMISDIDFDYASYAQVRLGEYRAWKAEYDGSRKKSGQEMPLRERRWAET